MVNKERMYLIQLPFKKKAKQKEETQELDLEQCVNKNYAQLVLPECGVCEGYDYNCPSYYKLGEYIKTR